MDDDREGWGTAPDEEFEEDGDEDEFEVGFESILSPFLGYEVALSGSNPVELAIVRPSTDRSSAILVGVYADCVAISEKDRFRVIPYALLTASIPRDEWESIEFTAIEE